MTALRLTLAEEEKSLTVEPASTFALQQTSERKVFLYGVLLESNSQLVGNPLIAYAQTEGYTLESRDINQLGSDLLLGPEAVVINPASAPFDQLLLFFSFFAPSYAKTLFLFNSPTPSEAQRAFWRNFGVLTILPTPLTPLELFSLIKVFRRIAGKVEPVIDFSITADFPARLVGVGDTVDFTLTVRATLGANFTVSLSFAESEVGTNIKFLPPSGTVPFTSICRLVVPVELRGKTANFLVKAESGSKVKYLKLTVVVLN